MIVLLLKKCKHSEEIFVLLIAVDDGVKKSAGLDDYDHLLLVVVEKKQKILLLSVQ